MDNNQKPTYTIAVTGLNAIDSPGPGFAVIRSLKDAESFNVRIIGLAYEALEPVIYLREYVDKVYQIPYPTAGQEVLFDRLHYINSVENIDFLFPNFDAELFSFIRLELKILMELNIKMALPTLEQFEARHKVNLYEYGIRNDLNVPKAQQVYTAKEISSHVDQIGFPMVIKGKFYDAKIAYNLEQANQYFNKISSEWGLPILLQEFVRGVEVNVCGIGDGKGNLLGAVPMRKLYITDKGKAWSGITLDDKELLDITSKMVKKTKWKGPFELEFIKCTEDKEDVYKLIEINPRFPAWCYLTTGSGQNQVETLINMAFDQPYKKHDSYQIGKMFIRYSFDQIVDLKDFETISTTGEL